MKVDGKYYFHKNDNTLTPFVVSKGFFTKEECEAIVEMGKGCFEKSKMEGTEEEKKSDWRKSSNLWIPYNQNTEWIYQKMEEAVHAANNWYWQFELSGFAEDFQLTRYQKGDRYKRHVDAGLSGTPMPRKLSLVVQLSDPADYEGGALQVLCTTGNEEMLRGQGDVVVFPSFTYHEVEEITKGTRYSLVSWVGGPPFR